MSIQRLPVFLSAAEHLNFPRAAEEQCISQTAVSQQIKLLEQELGYALFVRGKRGVRLTPGMVIAIEPMINAGTKSVRVLEDGWTTVTTDGSLSAHFEHTVAITPDGPVILTRP